MHGERFAYAGRIRTHISAITAAPKFKLFHVLKHRYPRANIPSPTDDDPRQPTIAFPAGLSLLFALEKWRQSGENHVRPTGLPLVAAMENIERFRNGAKVSRMIGTVHGRSVFIMVNGNIDTTPNSHLRFR